jgi:hypothetical protein
VTAPRVGKPRTLEPARPWLKHDPQGATGREHLRVEPSNPDLVLERIRAAEIDDDPDTTIHYSSR